MPQEQELEMKFIEDKSGNRCLPITHVNAVRNSNGDTLPEILDRDYPTTSKTPVEDSTEVSLVTRGEKYEWNKVGNATDAAGASDITSTFKYLLLNGTTGEFETALKSVTVKNGNTIVTDELGTAFYGWLPEIGAVGKDALGTSRGAAWWPGA